MDDSGFDVALIRVRFYTYSISHQNMQPVCVGKVRELLETGAEVFHYLYALLSLHFSLAVH